MKTIAAAALLVLVSAPAPAQHGHSHDSHGPSAKAAGKPYGAAADPRSAKRVIRVEMGDNMRFTPAEITVGRGEAVRFVAANKGQVLHEMVLGTLAELKTHAQAMRQNPGMAHDEAHMLHIAPGSSGEIGWRFTRTGTFYYACLVPGHFESGMMGKIVVTP
jgi:uncharacterized cupredoxin-like copper-binding protein